MNDQRDSKITNARGNFKAEATGEECPVQKPILVSCTLCGEYFDLGATCEVDIVGTGANLRICLSCLRQAQSRSAEAIEVFEESSGE